MSSPAMMLRRPRAFPYWWHAHRIEWPLSLTHAEFCAYRDLAELRERWAARNRDLAELRERWAARNRDARRYDPPALEIPGWAWFMLAFCVSFAVCALAYRGVP